MMQLKQIFDGSKSDHEAKAMFEASLMSWFKDETDSKKENNKTFQLGSNQTNED